MNRVLAALLCLLIGLAGADARFLRGYGGAAGAAPTNTVAPVIAGTGGVGNTLTRSSPGTWTGSPSSYTDQWYQDASLIVGATATTYVQVSGDVGHTITDHVTAHNAFGTGTATSNGIAVPGAAPVNTVAPVASGTPSPSGVISTTTGTWTGTPTITYTYQWYQDTTGTPIAGATSASYTVQSGDVGHNLFAVVTGTNGYGNGTGQSNSLLVGNILAANYYVDYAGGSDTANTGTSTASPFQHAPGDTACTGNCSSASVTGGTKICFKGGVEYHGKINTKSGTGVGTEVTYMGNCWPYGTKSINTGMQDEGSLTFTATTYGGACPGATCISSAVVPNPATGINTAYMQVQIDGTFYAQAEWPTPAAFYWQVTNPAQTLGTSPISGSGTTNWTVTDKSNNGIAKLQSVVDQTMITSADVLMITSPTQQNYFNLTSYNGSLGVGSNTWSQTTVGAAVYTQTDGYYSGNPYTFHYLNLPDFIDTSAGWGQFALVSTVAGVSQLTLYANVNPGSHDVKIVDQNKNYAFYFLSAHDVIVDGFSLPGYYAVSGIFKQNASQANINVTNNDISYYGAGAGFAITGINGGNISGNTLSYSLQGSYGITMGSTTTNQNLVVDSNVLTTLGYSGIASNAQCYNCTWTNNSISHISASSNSYHGGCMVAYDASGVNAVNYITIKNNEYHDCLENLTTHGGQLDIENNVADQTVNGTFFQHVGGVNTLTNNAFLMWNTLPLIYSPASAYYMIGIEGSAQPSGIGGWSVGSATPGQINMTANIGDTISTGGAWTGTSCAAQGSPAGDGAPIAATPISGTLTGTTEHLVFSGPLAYPFVVGGHVYAQNITPSNWNIGSESSPTTVTATSNTGGAYWVEFTNASASGTFTSNANAAVVDPKSNGYWGCNWTSSGNISTMSGGTSIPAGSGWTLNTGLRTALQNWITTPSDTTDAATVCTAMGWATGTQLGPHGKWTCP